MKSFLKENYFLLFALLPLLITFICLQVNIPVWDKSTQKILFYSPTQAYVLLNAWFNDYFHATYTELLENAILDKEP